MELRAGSAWPSPALPIPRNWAVESRTRSHRTSARLPEPLAIPSRSSPGAHHVESVHAAAAQAPVPHQADCPPQSESKSASLGRPPPVSVRIRRSRWRLIQYGPEDTEIADRV